MKKKTTSCETLQVKALLQKGLRRSLTRIRNNTILAGLSTTTSPTGGHEDPEQSTSFEDLETQQLHTPEKKGRKGRKRKNRNIPEAAEFLAREGC